jgi:hypothetical protein
VKDKRRPAKDRHVRVKNNPTRHITKGATGEKGRTRSVFFSGDNPATLDRRYWCVRGRSGSF